MKVSRMLLWIVAIAIVLYLAATAYLYFAQRRLVFVPFSSIEITPKDVLLEYEDVEISVDGGQKIHGWYVPVAGAERVVLFCHGNAGNISHRLETAQFLADLGVNLLLFDYRGYGNSDGKPSEENTYADAQAAYNWLLARGFEPQQTVIFGRSLGGAVAVDLATRVECSGLIVESSFTSATDIGKKMFPFMPIRTLLRYEFASADKIAHADCRVLVTHSPDDEVIPYEMGRRLFELAREPKRFVELSGGHNERLYFESAEYVRGVRWALGLSENAGD